MIVLLSWLWWRAKLEVVRRREVEVPMRKTMSVLVYSQFLEVIKGERFVRESAVVTDDGAFQP